METLIFEGVVTALSSISHNGGQSFGISSKLRREKFIQPDGEAEEIPVISGNSLRGYLRDRSMLHMCRALGYRTDGYEFTATAEKVSIQAEEGKKPQLTEDEQQAVRWSGLTLPAFHFLFSGGSLTSEGGKAIDIEKARSLRHMIPLVGIFGGATGNVILPGKLKVGKMIPLCAETLHLIPDRFHPTCTQSIWEYTQEEMYTRKDDAKNEHLRPLLASTARPELTEVVKQDALIPDPADDPPRQEGQKQQMMYYIETLAAGTRFHWKITLDDVWPVEFEAFLCGLAQFSRMPYIGGKSAVGHGEISVNFDKWLSIDSRVQTESTEVSVPLGQLYQQHLQEHGEEIRRTLRAML